MKRRIPLVSALPTVAMLAIGLFCFSGISTADVSAQAGRSAYIGGDWVGYYDDGTKSPYVWSINQTGSTISIENIGGETAKSRGRVTGNKVFAQDFGTQNGVVSDNGSRIKWSDGVVWVRLPSLNGVWNGYYEDGSKSPFVWQIGQIGTTFQIENVGGKTAKSKGRIDGNKIVAQDFATQNGTVSADSSRITWSDRVVWVKEVDISGTWIGYYEDGSKSPYVWSIRQTGSTLSIENVGGQAAKSSGRIEGNKVLAQDFATKNGTLSADSVRITWSDGVVWEKQ
jgi:hypothetical protein